MTPLAELKKTHRATWASGDYPAVAERIDEVPPRDLLDRIDVRPGENVLDVATGTGNVALRANFNPIGRVIPKLGVGFVFPLTEVAHQETHWGIFTSLVFEY